MEVDYPSIIQSIRETAQQISIIAIYTKLIINSDVSRQGLLLLVVEVPHIGERTRRSIKRCVLTGYGLRFFYSAHFAYFLLYSFDYPSPVRLSS